MTAVTGVEDPRPPGGPAADAFPRSSPGAAAPRPRLVALDVDGTLLTSDHRLTPDTVEAIARVRRQGVAVVLVTSRPPIAVHPILSALGMHGPEAAFVGSQGALTGWYSGDGELHVLHQHPMALASARAAIAVAAAAGLAVNWYTGTQWLVRQLDERVAREAEVVGCRPEVVVLEEQASGPDKLLLIAPADDRAVLDEVARAMPTDLRAQTSNPTYLEVTRADVDKAAALAAHCAARGIPARSVVAMGDGRNDLGMLAYAGTAVAPANAHPEVRAAAGLLTASNDDDGVARALRLLVP